MMKQFNNKYQTVNKLKTINNQFPIIYNQQSITYNLSRVFNIQHL